MKRLYSVIAPLALMAKVAAPACAADLDRGAQLARQWCSSCHLLSGTTGQSVLQGPPSFREIAGSRSPDQMRVFLMHPHGSMPPLSLSHIEIDALIGFIESQR